MLGLGIFRSVFCPQLSACIVGFSDLGRGELAEPLLDCLVVLFFVRVCEMVVVLNDMCQRCDVLEKSQLYLLPSLRA